MTVRLAINGFGRIGRLVGRAILERNLPDVELVAVNDLAPIETNAHLFRYDSVHGRYHGEVSVDGDYMVAGGHKIRMTSLRDPAQLPWKELNIDVALECTGVFTAREQAAQHLTAGAKRVLISAPAKGADLTVVYGVNHQKLTADHQVVSNASCTTNCLAPLARVLHDLAGIETGFMTTVHAYTNDQNVLDQVHKDPYRARAAAVNMIPTSTGAASAVGLVLPELAGRLDGVAVRVPTPNVSMVDLKFIPSRDISVAEINNALTEAANGPLAGVLAVTSDPCVSMDFNHCAASSTVALDQTKVIGQRMARVMSWYDNEWGFSNRMVDTARHIASLI